MNDLTRYRRERLPGTLVLTVAVLLALAGMAATTQFDAAIFCWNLILAAVLMIQFRLWDDLMDVDTDRLQFPDRVLCRLESHRPFWLGVLLLFAINCAAIGFFKSWTTAVVFVSLNIVFFVWYYLVRGYFSRFLNVMFVLAKYPAFTFVIADAPALKNRIPVIISMVAVSVVACLYEILHNKRDHK